MKCPFANCTETAWHGSDVPAGLRALLESGDWQRGATLIAARPKRSTYRLALAPQDPPALFIKHDHPVSWRDRVKSFWRCKTEEEFLAGRALQAAGVPCVPMLAWGNRGFESWLVTAEISGARSFWSVWLDCRGDPSRRERFLRGLAAFVRVMAAAGVRHPDLHAANVLAVEADGEVSFHLLDVYGVRLGRALAGRQGERLLLWLGGVYQNISVAEAALFLRNAGVSAGQDDFPALWRRLWHLISREGDRRWRGRQQRLLTTGSLIEEHESGQGRWRLVRGFDLTLAQAAAEARHMEQSQETKSVLKHDAKRAVTRVQVQGQSLIVKEYRRLRWRGRWSPDARAWLNGHRLARRGIPVPQTLAWLEATEGPSCIVLEDVGPWSLVRVLRRPDLARRERSRLLREAGIVLAKLHLSEVWHSDFKAQNLMVRDGHGPRPGPFVVVDLDQVLFGFGHQPVIAHWRRRNLEQLLESFVNSFEPRAALRILAGYRYESLLSRQEMRRLRARLRLPPRGGG